MLFNSGSAAAQNGHWKSANSTMVTFASRGPSRSPAAPAQRQSATRCATGDSLAWTNWTIRIETITTAAMAAAAVSRFPAMWPAVSIFIVHHSSRGRGAQSPPATRPFRGLLLIPLALAIDPASVALAVAGTTVARRRARIPGRTAFERGTVARAKGRGACSSQCGSCCKEQGKGQFLHTISYDAV